MSLTNNEFSWLERSFPLPKKNQKRHTGEKRDNGRLGYSICIQY